MRKIVVIANVTLDGVMQAPGRPDEDPRGGFTRGGWALPYNDAVKAEMLGRGMTGTGALLLGRRTYEDFYSVWPHRTGNQFSELLNTIKKYVVSKTLNEPLPWQNSALLRGEASDVVGALKAQPGPDLTIIGSGELARSLANRRLIDEYVLLTHPLVLGSGTRFFSSVAPSESLQLVAATPTGSGVIIASYKAA